MIPIPRKVAMTSSAMISNVMTSSAMISNVMISSAMISNVMISSAIHTKTLEMNTNGIQKFREISLQLQVQH